MAFLLPDAVIAMSVDSPGVQDVPAAICCVAAQVPLAHCWKLVPDESHEKVPSGLQAPDLTVPDEPEPVPADAEAAGAAVELEATGAAVVVGAAVALALLVVMKTPPGTEVAAAEVAAAVVGDAATDVAVVPDPEPVPAVTWQAEP